MTPRKLAIGDCPPLPLEFATQTCALLGKRGVGKTHCAVVFAEELLDAGIPVVILDPIGVWWGLRSSADGKAKGHAILVLGGEHGDLPLDATQGALVAGWVVAKRRSVIVDMGEFSKGDQARFVTEFLEQLYRKNREPLHIIIDEADAFAPQRLFPGIQRCFGAVDQVVRRGRARGLGVTLVTQRSAAINKDVLSQVEVLIAFRTLAPQDRAAIDTWIDVHADRTEAGQVRATLHTLEVGEAWLWSPAWLQTLVRVRIRRRKTFDSSATPKVGAVVVAPRAAAAIDVDELRGELAALVQKADLEDPRRLRARLAQLERELAIAKSVKPAIDQGEKVRELLERNRRLDTKIEQAGRVTGRLASIETDLQGLVAQVQQAGNVLRGLREAMPPARGIGRVPAAAAVASTSPDEQSVHPALVRAAAAGGVSLDRPSRAILTVLAQHPGGCDRNRLTLLAGYRWSGGFRNALGALRTSGRIAGANVGLMIITNAGLLALGPYEPLPAGDGLRAYWLSHASLGTCERAVLTALIGARNLGMTTETLMKSTNYAWSGGFRNALGKLRTAGLIEGRNSDVMRASAHLLEDQGC